MSLAEQSSDLCSGFRLAQQGAAMGELAMVGGIVGIELQQKEQLLMRFTVVALQDIEEILRMIAMARACTCCSMWRVVQRPC